MAPRLLNQMVEGAWDINRVMQCPQVIEQLNEYAGGRELSRLQFEKIQQHLRGCENCRHWWYERIGLTREWKNVAA